MNYVNFWLFDWLLERYAGDSLSSLIVLKFTWMICCFVSTLDLTSGFFLGICPPFFFCRFFFFFLEGVHDLVFAQAIADVVELLMTEEEFIVFDLV